MVWTRGELYSRYGRVTDLHLEVEADVLRETARILQCRLEILVRYEGLDKNGTLTRLFVDFDNDFSRTLETEADIIRAAAKILNETFIELLERVGITRDGSAQYLTPNTETTDESVAEVGRHQDSSTDSTRLTSPCCPSRIPTPKESMHVDDDQATSMPLSDGMAPVTWDMISNNEAALHNGNDEAVPHNGNQYYGQPGLPNAIGSLDAATIAASMQHTASGSTEFVEASDLDLDLESHHTDFANTALGYGGPGPGYGSENPDLQSCDTEYILIETPDSNTAFAGSSYNYNHYDQFTQYQMPDLWPLSGDFATNSNPIVSNSPDYTFGTSKQNAIYDQPYDGKMLLSESNTYMDVVQPDISDEPTLSLSPTQNIGLSPASFEIAHMNEFANPCMTARTGLGEAAVMTVMVNTPIVTQSPTDTLNLDMPQARNGLDIDSPDPQTGDRQLTSQEITTIQQWKSKPRSGNAGTLGRIPSLGAVSDGRINKSTSRIATKINDQVSRNMGSPLAKGANENACVRCRLHHLRVSLNHDIHSNLEADGVQCVNDTVTGICLRCSKLTPSAFFAPCLVISVIDSELYRTDTTLAKWQRFLPFRGEDAGRLSMVTTWKRSETKTVELSQLRGGTIQLTLTKFEVPHDVLELEKSIFESPWGLCDEHFDATKAAVDTYVDGCMTAYANEVLPQADPLTWNVFKLADSLAKRLNVSF